jgi:PAS domain S-box-containing protein
MSALTEEEPQGPTSAAVANAVPQGSAAFFPLGWLLALFAAASALLVWALGFSPAWGLLVPALLFGSKQGRRRYRQRQARAASAAAGGRLREWPLPALHLDAAQRIVALNPAAERLLGQTAEELLGKSLADCCQLPQGLLGDLSRWSAADQEGGNAGIEVDWPTPRGSQRRIALLAVPLAAEQAARGQLLALEDRSELRRAQRQLKHADSRFRLLADSAPVLIWTCGVDARHDWFNQAWITFTGRELATECGSGWLEGVHPEDRERCQAVFLESFYARRAFSIEFRLRRFDGQYRRLLDRGTPRFGPADEFLGFVGSCLDIEDLRQQETARQAAQARLASLLENIHGGYLRVSAEGPPRVLAASAVVARLSGHDQREFESCALYWADLVHPEDRARRSAAMANGGAFCVEYRLCGAAGAQRWIREQGHRLLDENGQPVWDSVVLDISEQHRVAAELARTDERMRGLLEECTDIIAWEFDPVQQRFVYLSNSAADWGYPREDWDQPDFIERVVPDGQAELVRGAMARVLERGEEQRLLNPVMTKDGRRLLISKRIGLGHAEDGSPRLYGFCQDITAQRTQAEWVQQARQAAEDEHARLELALANGGLGLWDMRLDAQQVLCDERLRAMLGWPASDAVLSLHEWSERVHPDDQEVCRTSFALHLKGSSASCEAEIRIRHGDGGYRHMQRRGKLVERDEQGAPKRVVGTLCDLTGVRADQERLAAQSALLRQVLETIPYMVFWKDRESRYLGCNRAFAAAAGLSDPADIVGRTDFDLPWSTPESEAYRADDREVLDNGRTKMHIAESQTLSDGRVTWIDTSKVPLVNGRGELLGVLGIYCDITQQRQREQELAQLRDLAESANKAKSEFLANMSHEIRTPLSALMGYAELLAEDPALAADPERRARTLETIRGAGEHLLTVINDILDLSKIEAGRMECERVDFNLLALIGATVTLLRPRAEGQGIAFACVFETALPERIVGDPTRLRQVLLNLCGNALKFTECGAVRVRLGVHGDGPRRLRIDVEDSGPGIAPEVAERLFTSFGQADSSTTRRHGGSGLGLAISRRLARLMGGDVTLLSTELGVGSLFRFEVPVEVSAHSPWLWHLESQCADPVVAPTAALPTQVLPGRVLLAEDGPDNQRLIAHHLRRAGAEVEIAGNGALALSALRQAERQGRGFDLLVTDIQMPELDGLSLVRQLRREGCGLPILALTAHAMAEDQTACLEAGCDAYAAKPVNRSQLLNAIECARAQARLRQAAPVEAPGSGPAALV